MLRDSICLSAGMVGWNLRDDKSASNKRKMLVVSAEKLVLIVMNQQALV